MSPLWLDDIFVLFLTYSFVVLTKEEDENMTRRHGGGVRDVRQRDEWKH